MFYSGMMGAMGGDIGNAGAVDVAGVFKKRMQQGNSLGDIFFNRPAEAMEEAKRQRMEAEILDQFNKSRAAAPMPGMGATPGAFLGSQMGNVAGISFDINESPKNRKMRGIRKLSETGTGGEKDAAIEKLKQMGGPQLPLAMGAMSPGFFLGSQMGMAGGLPPMGNLGTMVGGMIGRGIVN